MEDVDQRRAVERGFNDPPPQVLGPGRLRLGEQRQLIQVHDEDECRRGVAASDRIHHPGRRLEPGPDAAQLHGERQIAEPGSPQRGDVPGREAGVAVDLRGASRQVGGDRARGGDDGIGPAGAQSRLRGDDCCSHAPISHDRPAAVRGTNLIPRARQSGTGQVPRTPRLPAAPLPPAPAPGSAHRARAPADSPRRSESRSR